MKNKEFLKSQKILRLATIDPAGNPHIVPVGTCMIRIDST